MSVSCGTGTAAVESEGAACRLEAAFLCGLHTFVHLWALAHVEPFDLHVDRRPPLLHRRDAAVPVGAGLCTRDAKSVQDSVTAPRGVTGSTGPGRG